MKYLKLALVAAVAAAALSGCYYDPGYSYVRGTPGYNGSAYYGRAAGYDDDYYGAPAYYGGGYYGSGYYGCCYAPGVSLGISSTWYGGSRYRDDGRGRYRDDHRYRQDHDDHRDGRRPSGRSHQDGGVRGGDRRDGGYRRHDDKHDRR